MQTHVGQRAFHVMLVAVLGWSLTTLPAPVALPTLTKAFAEELQKLPPVTIVGQRRNEREIEDFMAAAQFAYDAMVLSIIARTTQVSIDTAENMVHETTFGDVRCLSGPASTTTSNAPNYPDKWLAASEALRAALRRLPAAVRGAVRLRMIRGAIPFTVTYADGATEDWPLNPNAYGSVLLVEEPVPDTLTPPDTASEPRCGQG